VLEPELSTLLRHFFASRLLCPSSSGNLRLSQPISGPKFWSHSSKSSGSLYRRYEAVRGGMLAQVSRPAAGQRIQDAGVGERRSLTIWLDAVKKNSSVFLSKAGAKQLKNSK
jgi:hypothetical protein